MPKKSEKQIYQFGAFLSAAAETLNGANIIRLQLVDKAGS
jgi:hypothetical protein